MSKSAGYTFAQNKDALGEERKVTTPKNGWESQTTNHLWLKNIWLDKNVTNF